MTAQICVLISVVSGEVPPHVKVYSKHSQHISHLRIFIFNLSHNWNTLSHKPIS